MRTVIPRTCGKKRALLLGRRPRAKMPQKANYVEITESEARLHMYSKFGRGRREPQPAVHLWEVHVAAKDMPRYEASGPDRARMICLRIARRWPSSWQGRSQV